MECIVYIGMTPCLIIGDTFVKLALKLDIYGIFHTN